MLPLPSAAEGGNAVSTTVLGMHFFLWSTAVSYQLGEALAPLAVGLCWVFLEDVLLPRALFCPSQAEGCLLLLGNFPEAEAVLCVFWKDFGIVSTLRMGG